MTVSRFVAPAATILFVACLDFGAAAQVQPIPERRISPPSTPSAIQPPQQPATLQVPSRPGVLTPDMISKPGGSTPLLNRPGLNITKWGIAERQGSRTHGKVGETVFIEGRDLDPNVLAVEARLGNRAARLSRKPGGSSSRVEFTITPEAVTGDITATLQAVGNGNTVLSSDFGICDRPRITRVLSPITYQLEDSAGNDEYLMGGKVLTLWGECLDEIDLLTGRSDFAGNISIGQHGILLVKRVISKDYAKVELELHSFKRVGGSNNQRVEGPLRLTVPATGPNLVVDEARNAAAAGAQSTPPPASFVPITIQSVESNTRWGSRELPFVVVSSVANGSTPILQNPFFVDRQIRIAGQNLLANPGTTWSIGTVPLTPPNVNSMTSLPSNAVSGQVCAVRRDGVRSCAPATTVVIASPKIGTAPAGWPLMGTIDRSTRVEAGIRRTLTITGFDLKPPPGLGMEAVVEVSNFDHAAAAQCDLDLQVHRFDRGTLTFSFGTPGGTRPATCTEQDEANVSFLRTPAEFKLKWVYEGDPAATKFIWWNVVGER